MQQSRPRRYRLTVAMSFFSPIKYSTGGNPSLNKRVP
jgi:hypothetical protein